MPFYRRQMRRTSGERMCRPIDAEVTHPIGEVNPGIAYLLRRLQWTILHTCVHESEPICSEDCLEHIHGEVCDLIDLVREIGGELGFLDCCERLRKTRATEKIHSALDKMGHELDTLSEKLRERLSQGSSDHMYTGVRNMLSEACKHMHSVYRDLVKDMLSAGLIDHHLSAELVAHF